MTFPVQSAVGFFLNTKLCYREKKEKYVWFEERHLLFYQEFIYSSSDYHTLVWVHAFGKKICVQNAEV